MILFFVVLIIEIFMPAFVFLIAPGFDGDNTKMELAINLTRITFPFLLFISLSSFFSAILNSHNRFAVASAVPIILNMLLIGVLSFGKILNDQLVYYLSYAVTVSGVIQLIFLYLCPRYPNLSFHRKFQKFLSRISYFCLFAQSPSTHPNNFIICSKYKLLFLRKPINFFIH